MRLKRDIVGVGGGGVGVVVVAVLSIFYVLIYRDELSKNTLFNNSGDKLTVITD